MSRVVFMCGPAGSGKSTHARQLEAEGFVRLSFDQRAWQQGHRSMPLPDGVRERIAAELRTELLALVDAGRDVVLDFSFWSRAMRDEWRALLASTDADIELVRVVTPRAVALERLRARSASHGDDFALDEGTAAAYHDHFEPPGADEGPVTIVTGG